MFEGRTTQTARKCDRTSDRALLTAERNTSLLISQPYFHNHTGPMQLTPHVHTHVLNSAGHSLLARNKHLHRRRNFYLFCSGERGGRQRCPSRAHNSHTTHLSTAAFNSTRSLTSARTPHGARPHFHLAKLSTSRNGTTNSTWHCTFTRTEPLFEHYFAPTCSPCTCRAPRGGTKRTPRIFSFPRHSPHSTQHGHVRSLDCTDATCSPQNHSQLFQTRRLISSVGRHALG